MSNQALRQAATAITDLARALGIGSEKTSLKLNLSEVIEPKTL